MFAENVVWIIGDVLANLGKQLLYSFLRCLALILKSRQLLRRNSLSQQSETELGDIFVPNYTSLGGQFLNLIKFKGPLKSINK